MKEPTQQEKQAELPLASPLVAGEDYYSEGATIVFTARFLLRRGYCCDSGCRHCPYGDETASDSCSIKEVNEDEATNKPWGA